jgi:hypothetical protein
MQVIPKDALGVKQVAKNELSDQKIQQQKQGGSKAGVKQGGFYVVDVPLVKIRLKLNEGRGKSQGEQLSQNGGVGHQQFYNSVFFGA